MHTQKFFRTPGSLLLVAALAGLTACATPMPQQGASAPAQDASRSMATMHGQVTRIEVVPAEQAGIAGLNTGAVVGAVLGAVAGSQVGGGSGRILATGAGAVGGGLIGSTMGGQQQPGANSYRVTVRFDNGQSGQYNYAQIDNLRVGDRVRSEGGQLYRQ